MEGLGLRIRSLRKGKRMTLVEIAKKTGIDQATLSRIENGVMVGTLNSHMKIAEALGIRLPELYGHVLSDVDDTKSKAVKERLEKFYHSSGAVSELLTTGVLQKKMMPIVLKIKARGFTETEEYSPGSERFVYVLKGALELSVGTRKSLLKTGQGHYFSASEPHHFKNTGKIEAQCLSVITPTAL